MAEKYTYIQISIESCPIMAAKCGHDEGSGIVCTLGTDSVYRWCEDSARAAAVSDTSEPLVGVQAPRFATAIGHYCVQRGGTQERIFFGKIIRPKPSVGSLKKSFSR